ncbi:MAG: DUF2059 domain-containing protein [Pseudomonadota bacterium]
MSLQSSILAAAFVLGSAASASGQTPEAAARAYVAVPSVAAALDRMLSAEGLAETVRPGMLAQGMPPELADRILPIMAEEMAAIGDELTEMMVVAVAEHFTVAEIEALSAFYATTEGASVMAKMQPMMTSFMTRALPLQQAAIQRASRRVQEETQQ